MLTYLEAFCIICFQDLFEGDDIRNLKMTETIDYHSDNTESLGDLFLGFLDYYSNRFR